MISDFTKLHSLWHCLTHRSQVISQPSENEILLGETSQKVPVVLSTPDNISASHALVLASSGAGKTVLVANLLATEFIRQQTQPPKQQHAYFILDPKKRFNQAHHSSHCCPSPGTLA